jgi:hypothetical protein
VVISASPLTFKLPLRLRFIFPPSPLVRAGSSDLPKPG